MARKVKLFRLMPPFIIEAPRDTKWLRLERYVDRNEKMETVEVPVVYAEVDDAGFDVKHTFTPYPTGAAITEGSSYVGTIKMEDKYVIHFYRDSATYDGLNG